MAKTPQEQRSMRLPVEVWQALDEMAADDDRTTVQFLRVHLTKLANSRDNQVRARD